MLIECFTEVVENALCLSECVIHGTLKNNFGLVSVLLEPLQASFLFPRDDSFLSVE